MSRALVSSALVAAKNIGFARRFAGNAIKSSEEVGSFTADPKAQLERLRVSLALRISMLDSDGMHDNGKRQEVVGRYYDAALNIEERLLKDSSIKPNSTSFDGKVENFCIESNAEKAKGVAVILKDIRSKAVLGRMFIANCSAGSCHLTLLNAFPELVPHIAKSNEEKSALLIAQMISSYLDDRALSEKQKNEELERNVRTSCVGLYRDKLQSFSRKNPLVIFSATDDYGNPVYDVEALSGNSVELSLKPSFSMREFYNLGIKILEELTPKSEVKSGETKPLANSAKITEIS